MFNNRKKYWLFPFMALAFVLIGGFVVMHLWNFVLPVVIKSVGYLTYWQAVALLVLSKLLFGGFRGGQHNGGFSKETFKEKIAWRDKMMSMSHEDREKFKAEWKERCRRK